MLIKISVSIINLTIVIGTVVDGVSSADADCDADKTGEYDKQTTHRYKHNPRKLHAEYQIIHRV